MWIDNNHVAWCQQQVITELTQENGMYKYHTHYLHDKAMDTATANM